VAGRRRKEVTADGVISGGPDGTQTFNPWSALADARADTAFLLLGHDGKVLCLLPSRALPRPRYGDGIDT